MSLKVYQRKRNFKATPEPKGKLQRSAQGPLRFVVQMHSASRLHFDLRLEFDGVYKSWAVPKGPSLNPLDQRLAVFVEDHPLDYGTFEGVIPEGNYGAGTVMLWDHGTYVERGSQGRKDSQAAMKKGLENGHLTFVLKGEKLNGEFALIQLKKDKAGKAWLLVKKRDEHSTNKRNFTFDPCSVKTGRTLDEIAAESLEKGDVWLPKRKAASKAATVKSSIRSIPARPEAMPRKIKPMIATVSRAAVDGDGWFLEKEMGGLRALAEVEGKRVNLYSKSGLPFGKKFPAVVDALKALNQTVALDGEILQPKGKPFYRVFDVLYSEGKDLRDAPLSERKEILTTLLSRHESPVLGMSEPLAFDGKPPLLKTGERLIAKNRKSTYRSGTSAEWLILPSSLTLKNDVKSPPLAVTRDEPRLTHLEKIFFPDDDITKGDLLDYYRKISKTLLPYLVDRPQSLNRHPNGIKAASFYQKDMTGHIPRWLKTERIFSESAEKSVDYVVCQDERSLLYIVNLGCIELNPWFSRIGHLDKPDFLVIDLDPDDNPFDHVIEVAQTFHKILDDIGAANFCKTSGATGIHIGVPTGARYDFDEVREFAEEVCRVVLKKFPATASMDRNPNRRKGKIYLDFMQNRRGQTLAAPFCVRPRPGAAVSMPLAWDALRPGVKPEQFHIGNAAKLAPKQDRYWKAVLGAPIDLKKCLRALRNAKH